MENSLNEQLRRIKTMMFLRENVQEFYFDETNKDLQDLGVSPLTDEEAEALMGCPEDEIPPQFENTYNRIATQIEKITDRNQLKSLFKEIKSLLRGTKKVQKEQLEAAPVMILGISLGTAALIAIGVLLLTKIISVLLKRRDKAYKPSCRAGASEMRRQFGRKLL